MVAVGEITRPPELIDEGSSEVSLGASITSSLCTPCLVSRGWTNDLAWIIRNNNQPKG